MSHLVFLSKTRKKTHFEDLFLPWKHAEPRLQRWYSLLTRAQTDGQHVIVTPALYAVNTLLSGLPRLKRSEDYVLDFTKHELCWEDDINKAQTLLSALSPRLPLLYQTLFHFRLVWMSSGKANESLKAPRLHKDTVFFSTKWATWVSENSVAMKSNVWLICLHATRRVHCRLWKWNISKSLGTGPSGDAN